MHKYVGGLMTEKAHSLGCIGAGVTGSEDLPYMLAGKQTWILWKSSMCSYLLSHLSSPDFNFLYAYENLT